MLCLHKDLYEKLSRVKEKQSLQLILTANGGRVAAANGNLSDLLAFRLLVWGMGCEK